MEILLEYFNWGKTTGYSSVHLYGGHPMTVVWGDVPKKRDYYDPDAKHPSTLRRFNSPIVNLTNQNWIFKNTDFIYENTQIRRLSILVRRRVVAHSF